VHVRDPRWCDLPLGAEGVVECQVKVPASALPPLPNTYRGSRVFGSGLQRGFWTLAEIRYATSLGAEVLRVYQACYGLQSIRPFTQFVATLWEMRQEYKRRGDPRSYSVKALLNNAYGRLGLRGGVTQETIEPWDPALSAADYAKMHAPRHETPSRGRRISLSDSRGVFADVCEGQPFVRVRSGVGYDHAWVNVLWAAQITALARIKLHRYLLLQGDAAVYADTDSVFSRAPIVGLGEGLGALSDPQTYARGWIVGPKLYRLERADGSDVVKAKGVPRDKALAFLKGREVVFSSPVSPRAQMRGAGSAGTWIELHRTQQLVPHRRTPVNPAALESDYGWTRTLPHHYGL